MKSFSNFITEDAFPDVGKLIAEGYHEDLLHKYAHSDDFYMYKGDISDNFPELVKKFPYKGGRIYRGLNFSNVREYMAFRRSIRGNVLTQDGMSSWGKTVETGRTFAKSRMVHQLNAMVASMYDPNERVMGFIGIILAVDVSAGVAIDVNASGGGVEDEVILPKGSYKIVDIQYEKKWKHLLSKIDINSEVLEILEKDGFYNDDEKMSRLRALFKYKGGDLYPEVKQKIVEHGLKSFAKTFHAHFEKDNNFDYFFRADEKQAYQVLFPDGRYTFYMDAYEGLVYLLDQGTFDEYATPALKAEVKQVVVKTLDEMTKVIHGKKVMIKYTNGHGMKVIAKRYGITIADTKYLKENYASTYHRWNEEMRVWNKKKHVDFSAMTKLLQDSMEGPF